MSATQSAAIFQLLEGPDCLSRLNGTGKQGPFDTRRGAGPQPAPFHVGARGRQAGLRADTFTLATFSGTSSASNRMASSVVAMSTKPADSIRPR